MMIINNIIIIIIMIIMVMMMMIIIRIIAEFSFHSTIVICIYLYIIFKYN